LILAAFVLKLKCTVCASVLPGLFVEMESIMGNNIASVILLFLLVMVSAFAVGVIFKDTQVTMDNQRATITAMGQQWDEFHAKATQQMGTMEAHATQQQSVCQSTLQVERDWALAQQATKQAPIYQPAFVVTATPAPTAIALDPPVRKPWGLENTINILLLCCLSLVCLVVPALVAFVLLRKKELTH
jgi:hypothetical protein